MEKPDDFSPVFDLLLGARDEAFAGEKKYRLFQMLWWVRDVNVLTMSLRNAAITYAVAEIGREWKASTAVEPSDAFLEATNKPDVLAIISELPRDGFGIAHAYALRSNPFNVRDHKAFERDQSKMSRFTEARLQLIATAGCRYNQDNAIAVCKLSGKGPGETKIKRLIYYRRDREPFLYAARRLGVDKWAFNRNLLEGEGNKATISPRLMAEVLEEHCTDLSWFAEWASMSKTIEERISRVPHSAPRDHISFGSAWSHLRGTRLPSVKLLTDDEIQRCGVSK